MSEIRSWLYVPADREDRLTKAGERGADAVIIDLEDGVAAANKDIARQTLMRWRAQVEFGGVPVWVRVNNEPSLLRLDLEAVHRSGVDGIVLPKATIASVRQAMNQLVEPVPLSALIESSEGVLEARAIAEVPLVQCVALGEVDLAADLNLKPSPDEREMWPYRAQLVLAAAAARLPSPCGPVSPDFTNLDAFRESTESLRRAGFGSRAAIHPAQVTVINEVFTPSLDEVEAARRLLTQFNLAAASGEGAFVDEHGRMVDEAVVRSARRIVELADR